MNLAHPVSEEFANILDKACGRMIALGLEGEAMYWLADELACMLSRDSFKSQPLIPHAKELYRIIVAITHHLKGGAASKNGLAEYARPNQGSLDITLPAPS